MTHVLILKLLRDLRLPLLIVMILLAFFQCLWAKVVEQIVGTLLPALVELGRGSNVSPEEIEEFIFSGPGGFVKTMIGGESVSMFRATDMLTVGYVHALVITILCIWAIGRAANAIVGEIDKGTMELLLAQPIARYKIVLAHFTVDILTIPLLCLSLWFGNWLGLQISKPGQTVIVAEPMPIKAKFLFGMLELALPQKKPATPPPPPKPIDARIFGPALFNVGAMVFAITGYTFWMSAAGRFRGKVLGIAVLVTLLQFLINVIGQLLPIMAPLRKFTIFFYYQPQPIILKNDWMVDLGPWLYGDRSLGHVHVIAVLIGVGLFGYLMGLWTFTRRDLPAPL